MTPAEALERVRARLERHIERSKAGGRRSPTADRLAGDALAILDAVAPDAPVTVEREALDLAARALGYHYDSHPIYGSTAACGGGIGGSVMTAHCTVLCDSPKHDKVRDEFLKLRAEYDALVARATPERTEQEREAAVERVARALAGMEPGEDWPTNTELGGNLTGTRDDEFRYAMREDAMKAIAAYEGREVSECRR